MTSQRVEGTWIGTGGYGQFRGEWVKELGKLKFNFHEHDMKCGNTNLNEDMIITVVIVI